MSLTCYKCQKDTGLETNDDISRSEECQNCYTNLRCCHMCKFYDKNSYNECREPTAERVLDKEKANFCDFFKLGSADSSSDSTQDLLAQANSLFKK